MQFIAYLLYGSRPEYHLELSYSVLSAARHLRRSPAPIRIALITDEANVREDLPVEHLLFTPAEFAEWTDGGSYEHQAHPRALAKALDHFGGQVALLDTDTYFVGHPARLFDAIGPGRSLMHAAEGPVGGQERWRAIFDALGDRAEVAGYPISREQPMYNSGVVGLDASDRALLEDACTLIREIYAIAPVFNVEQFAVGTVLGSRTQLSVRPELLTHYWGFERGFIHAQCERIFHARSRAHFDALVDAPELPKVGYPRKSLRDRLAARVVGRARGAGRLYSFALLAARSALRTAAHDPVYANVWARVALDALRVDRRKARAGKGRRGRRVHDRDFDAFRAPRIARLAWIDEETRRGWDEFFREAHAG